MAFVKGRIDNAIMSSNMFERILRPAAPAVCRTSSNNTGIILLARLAQVESELNVLELQINATHNRSR